MTNFLSKPYIALNMDVMSNHKIIKCNNKHLMMFVKSNKYRG